MRALLGLIFCLGSLAGYAMNDHARITYGYIEKARLVDKDLTLSAKLDTGAETASLNALNIEKITVKGKPYLRFIVPSKAGDIPFECEYVGNVNIKVRAAEAKLSPLLKGTTQRPVVLMRVNLGDKERIIKVNLTNRQRFIYPLLLGRDAITAFNGQVDPSLKYTHPIQEVR